MPLYYAARGHLIFMGKHFTRQQLAAAGLRYVAGFPRAVWDYSRITGQWTGPLYMLRALFDAVRTIRTGR